MDSEAHRPHVVMIVGNRISGDSRVQKMALSVAEAGWDVTVIGLTSGDYPRLAAMGLVRLYRVRPPYVLERHKVARLGLISKLLPVYRLGSIAHDPGYAAWQARDREIAVQVAWLTEERKQLDEQGLGNPLRRVRRNFVVAWIKLLRLERRIRRSIHRARGRKPGRPLIKVPKALLSMGRQVSSWVPRRYGAWRKRRPMLVDHHISFGPVIQALEPDLIHAHDMTMPGVAAQAAALITAKGKRVPWVYDAHEWVSGLKPQYEDPREAQAYAGYEAEYIHRADAVVTVSEELASLLQKRYHLSALPVVVANAPPYPVAAFDVPRLRDVVGVPDDVPLVVYSGWLAPERGVTTLVRALAYLPGVHLAIVVGQRRPHQQELEDLAIELGVRNRLHFAPYVPANNVVQYLSSASLGVIPILHYLNHEIALITKYYEYMHARLPIVVSDVRTMAEYTHRHGLGEVFRAGDPKSCAEAIKKVFADPERYTRNLTSELLDEHTWEHEIPKVLALYEHLVGTCPEPRSTTISGMTERAWGERPTHQPVARHEHGSLVGFGPANVGGQAWEWAKAIERHVPGIVTEVIAEEREGRDFRADVRVPPKRLSSLRWQFEQIERMLDRYTHIVVESLRSVFGSLNGVTIADDLPMLRNHGVHVAIVLHGTEIRNPRRHLDNYPFSPYSENNEEGAVIAIQRMADRNAALLSKINVPVFVSTPDLLDYAPSATWLPAVVDTSIWTPGVEPLERARPVVVHAPTDSWLYGTDLIEPIVQNLADKGLIEYWRIENVSPAELPAIVRHADVILDQFTLGTYGVFACQAMATGRVVLGHVHDRIRERLGAQLPILEATPETVGDVLARVVAERDDTRKVAASGLNFVHELHNGRRSAEALTSLFR